MENPYSRQCPYIYRGIVEDNVDPENLGRCKIRVPSIHGELNYSIGLLPWARPIVSSPVNSLKGSVNIPDIGDIVWVFFEGAVKDFPVYIGGTYAEGDLHIDTRNVLIHSEGDCHISYDRGACSYTIVAGNNAISIDKDTITVNGNLRVTGTIESAD